MLIMRTCVQVSFTIANHSYVATVLAIVNSADVQMTFTPHLEVVSGLQQPAVLVVVVGQVVDGKTGEGLEHCTEKQLVVNPTLQKVKKMGAQLQAQIGQHLWENVLYF